jgi:fatty acid-binding protein DegV
MKIVTDAAANLTPEQAAQLDVEVVPFPVTLVLGAHAGPTVIGLAAGPEAIFEGLRK